MSSNYIIKKNTKIIIHSSSSIDSTTRANTAHNRAIANTYTYTALSTSEDFLPVDFDDNINGTMEDNGMIAFGIGSIGVCWPPAASVLRGEGLILGSI